MAKRGPSVNLLRDHNDAGTPLQASDAFHYPQVRYRSKMRGEPLRSYSPLSDASRGDKCPVAVNASKASEQSRGLSSTATRRNVIAPETGRLESSGVPFPSIVSIVDTTWRSNDFICPVSLVTRSE